MRDLGADRFISAGAGQPGPAAGGFDVVIDTVGGAVLDGSYGLLREGGRLVTLGAPPDQEVAGRYKVHAMFFVVEPDASELARLAEMAGTGRLRPVISQTFPLAEGQQAFESGTAAAASRQDGPRRPLICQADLNGEIRCRTGRSLGLDNKLSLPVGLGLAVQFDVGLGERRRAEARSAADPLGDRDGGRVHAGSRQLIVK